MTLSILLCDQNLVLNMEVGDVIFQIYIFGDYKGTNNLVENFGNETIVGASRVDSAII